MELNKLFVALTAVSALALTACGSDSDSDSNSDSSNDDSSEVCATVGTLSDETYTIDGTDMAICNLSGTISEDATLTDEYVYRLNGYVTVGNGADEISAVSDVEEVTLTIDAGVQFRSSGRGSLIISRGSNIEANGTADAPILMASEDYDLEGQGEWGGLVLQGFAKNNNCGPDMPEVCNVADEADTGFHGGNDDADNSGSIQYLIVAEGGYEVAEDQEVNGITMHSVGYGTSIENVMVYGNADDGVEFFGGAVNVKNLILVDNGDESIDWDDGYRGNIQFALVRQGVSNAGDNGIEADNAGLSNTAEPVSNPMLSNITFQTAAEGSSFLMRAKVGTQGTLSKVAADNYASAFRIANPETSVTLDNVLVEFTGTEASNILRLDDEATEDNISGWSSTSTSDTVELGAAFEVTGSESTLAAATTDESANGSTGFFVETNYIGAVAPTVTSAENAWWFWASEVIPAAFED
ncbi:hypothetical protein [Oceanobacter sp. 4_MG-2023]|uniref:hypothetical protein n=1 Tax=Oceanobacter sp. 4_MG-2023 TaxID=3062623 RepID=UPI002736BBB9|nr:hypothetical protein [Oceanobacter sp. 4_MG-2023]MDP2547871.1 hypothetical protein [Oceanobacter sp. 4_MG-2023]